MKVPRLLPPTLAMACAAALPGCALAAQGGTAHQGRSPPTPIDRLAVAALKVPAPDRRTLSNGLQVLFVHDPRSPLFDARLVVHAGWRGEPAGLRGISRITRDVVRSGTTAASRPVLDGLFDSLGVAFTVGDAAGDNEGTTTTFRVSGVAAEAGAALALLSASVRDPAIRQTDVDAAVSGLARQRRQTPLGNPRAWALELTRRILGASPEPEQPDAAAGVVTREDVARFHREHYRPDNAWLVVVGPFSWAQAQQLAVEHFGSWRSRRAGRVPASLPRPERDATGAVVTEPVFRAVLRPGSAETGLALTAALDAATAADHAMIAVTSALLRDRMARRSAVEGWQAYVVSTPVPQFAYARTLSLVTSVPHSQVGWVLRAFRDELTTLAAVPVPDLEVDLARRAAVMLRLAESVVQARLGDLVLIGELRHGEAAYWSEYEAALRAANSDAFRRFANRLLATARIAIAAVGDSSGIAAAAAVALR